MSESTAQACEHPQESGEDAFLQIVRGCENLIERRFLDAEGCVFTFIGVIYGHGGYYYGMFGQTGLCMLECSSSPEEYGFTLLSEA